MTEKHQNIWTKPFLLLCVCVVALAILSLFVGVYDIQGQADGWQMFFITRVPRTLALLLTGAAMSMSGLVMQIITQNRFVEPTTTGTIEWAGLGLIFVYTLIPSPTIFQRMTGAIIFSFIGTMIFFMILRKIEIKSSLVIPIIGIMLGSIVSAVSTFFGLVFSLSQTIEVWFTGSFTQIQRGRYEYLWLIIIISVAIFLLANRLTVIGLGKEVTINLGINYNAMIIIAVALISLAVGIVTTVVGNLPFLGIVVPNIISIFRGDDLRSNLPWVCVLGMGFITVCDIVSRSLIMPLELPVSLILGTLGAGLFIMILLFYMRRQTNE